MESKYKQIIQTIIEKYGFDWNISNINISNINQYPHLFLINDFQTNYFVKIINPTKVNDKSIEDLYANLSNNGFIECPLKTLEGNYCVNFENNIIIIYRQLSEVKNSPSPEWWAKCLQSIHNTDMTNYSNKLSEDIYIETINIFQKASIYMSEQEINKINLILKYIDLNIKLENVKKVLCHSDPYDSNVLHIENEYKLIDTDNMMIAPKEFDIQRLLFNYAITCNNIDEFKKYWEKFKLIYENNINLVIDNELLLYLYSCDFVRTLSWLYIVSNDKERLDIYRQNEELKLYRKSLMSDIHLEVLEFFRRKEQ